MPCGKEHHIDFSIWCSDLFHTQSCSICTINTSFRFGVATFLIFQQRRGSTNPYPSSDAK